MKISIVSALAATLCALPAQSQTDNQVPLAKLESVNKAEVSSQIKKDLQDLAREWNGRKISDTASLFATNGPSRVFGARIGYFGAHEWLRHIGSTPFNQIDLVIDAVNASQIKADAASASANVSYHFKLPDLAEVSDKLRAQWESERQETLQFRRVYSVNTVDRLQIDEEFPNGDPLWQIVPPKSSPGELTTDPEKPQKANFWSIISYHLAQKQLPLQFSSVERSQRNLKQLSIATMQIAVDYNDRFAFAPPYMMEALTPYLRDVNIFQVPNTNEIYTFNGNLTNLHIHRVPSSQKTVLFYEGQNETPIFRYDGNAAIGFADGHVALVTPDQAKSLIWKP